MADEKVLITESTLDEIADAIREKNGESFKYYPREIPSAVRRIPTGTGGGSVVAVFPILYDGEHIADIVVDGETFEIYAPEQIIYTEGQGIEISGGAISVSQALRNTIAGKVDSDTLTTIVNNLNAAIAGKQDILTAGTGIEIVGNTISATGGGTTVIANPTGTPTEELSTIQIGEDIYEIVGGGSGGSGFAEETLWENTTGAGVGVYTLSKSIDNFDAVAFYYGVYAEWASGIKITDYRVVTVHDLNNLHDLGERLLLTGWGTRTVYVDIAGTTLNVSVLEGNQSLLMVRGIKFGSSGGSGYEETELYTASARAATMNLSDSIENYDAIEVEVSWLYNGVPYHISSIISSEVLSSAYNISYSIGTSIYRYQTFKPTDATTFVYMESDNDTYISKIKGIKYGAGGGGGGGSSLPFEIVIDPNDNGINLIYEYDDGQ